MWQPSHDANVLCLLQPISAMPVSSGSSVINVMGNQSQTVATAVPLGSSVQLLAQQPAGTSALPVVVSQSAIAARLVQPSANAVSAGHYNFCNKNVIFLKTSHYSLTLLSIEFTSCQWLITSSSYGSWLSLLQMQQGFQKLSWWTSGF